MTTTPTTHNPHTGALGTDGDARGHRRRIGLRQLFPASRVTLVLGVLIAGVGGAEAQRPEPRVHGTYQGDPMYTVLPLDAIPAIRDPDYVSGDAARRQMHDEEPVIGIVIGGEARAYSTWQLDRHEIVNDVIDGVPFAVTWCPLCHTGVVYDRRVGDRTLTLLVSGKLWRNSLVMQDEQTGSLWSHVSGEGLDGPLAGRTLRKLHGVQTTWEEWVDEHPETQVLDKPGRIAGSRYADYADDPDRYGIIRTQHQLGKLPGKSLVHGVAHGGEAVAVRDDELSEGDPVRAELGGDTVLVERGADGGVRAQLAGSGDPLPVNTAYWFAWVSFHPDSRVLPLP